MANLITQSLTFSKQSVTDYFIKPLFIESDIRDIVNVRTDIQGTEKLDLVDNLSKITKAYAQGSSFTSSSGVTVTQRTITVAKMKAEVQQAGNAFFNWVKEAALKKGYEWDNIEGTIFEEIVMDIFSQALKRDLMRQMFFGDTTKETISSGVRTGTADANYKEYNGFWTRIITDALAGTIERYTIAATTAAVKQTVSYTLSGTTAGTVTLTVSGVEYDEDFDTNVATTMTNWFNSHAATLLTRGITVTNPSAAKVLFTAVHPGEPFSVAATDAGTDGTLTSGDVVANVKASGLSAGQSITIFENLISNAEPELLESENLRFLVPRAVADNYRAALRKNYGTSELSYVALENGKKVLSFDGIPIIEMRSWDSIISTDFYSVYPYRCLLVDSKNLIFGTDAEDADMMFEMFYDKPSQKNYLRAQYKAGTQYLHAKLISSAF